MIRSKRYTALLLSALVLTFAACAKRDTASAVFSDKAAAQVAEAAAACDAARISELVKGGADPSAIGDKETSLLQWAMLNQCKAGFQALLAAGADPSHADDNGDAVIHYAAKANDPEYLDILLVRRVDPNTPNTRTGYTPLMMAIFGDREPQFHKLLAAGADPNLTDHFGNTALHVAAKINNFDRVLDLLKAGADPTARNRQGITFQRYLNMTPTNILSSGARRRNDDVVNWLREHNVPLEGAQPQSR